MTSSTIQNDNDHNNNNINQNNNAKNNVTIIDHEEEKEEQCQHQPQEQEQKQEQQSSLNWIQGINLFLSLLAWACTISNTTLVVGTSNVVIVAISNNNKSIATLPLGAFVIGSAIVSIKITNYLFINYGNKITFIFGTILFGIIGGTLLSILAIYYKLYILFIISTLFFGMANGINFYLRFIVTELVPIHFHAKAITLTISGGILAAFIGPETGNKTINLFPKHQYLGVYLMTGVLNFINVVCILCIQFTKTKEIKTDILEINDENKMKRLPTGTSSLSELNSTLPLVDEEIGSQNKKKDEVVETIDTFENKNIFVLWYSLLCNVDFLIPMFLSALAWTIMSLPMSLVRTTMADLGYTSIQSLRVMEFHFVGMFGTGLITGTLIQKYGYYIICIVGFIICCISVLLNLLVKYNITNNNTNDKNGTFFLWLFGMLLIGVGWNFSFTGATVWITKLYNLPKKDVSDTKQEAEIITLDIVDEEHKQSISVKDTVQYTKNQVQSTNDFFMFFLSGIWTFSASYIYKTSGGDLIGWKTINYTVIGLLILNLIIIIGYYFSHIWKKQK